MTKVTWTGAAGLQFETGRETILIDPYYTRVDIFDALLGPVRSDRLAVRAALPQMQTVKAVIVGHTHVDHALDVPHIARRTDCRVIGSRSLETLLKVYDLPRRVTVCNGGETIQLGDRTHVTMLPSAHGLVVMGRVPLAGEIRATCRPPLKVKEFRVGTVFAPKLEIEGQVFLHVGSANFRETEIAGHTCDVLFVCVPGWKKCTGYPLRLIEITQPKTVVLFHFDDFTKPHIPGKKTRVLPLSDIKGFIRTIKNRFPDVRICRPALNEPLSFPNE